MSALEDTIQDGRGQVFVMQNLSPLAKGFIGGEDHGSFSQVAVVDHMEQDIGGVQIGTLRWLETNAPFMNSIAITTGVLAHKTAMDTISIVFWAALIFTWAPQHASSLS